VLLQHWFICLIAIQDGFSHAQNMSYYTHGNGNPNLKGEQPGTTQVAENFWDAGQDPASSKFSNYLLTE
jgi:hypothetical protein